MGFQVFLEGWDRGTVNSYLHRERLPENWGIRTERIVMI